MGGIPLVADVPPNFFPAHLFFRRAVKQPYYFFLHDNKNFPRCRRFIGHRT